VVDTAAKGRVLLSTADLRLAGALRDRFASDGYDVELVTGGEDISGVKGPALLILTGELDRESGRGLASQAVSVLHIPVFGVVDPGSDDWRSVARDPPLDEVFPTPADPDEIVVLGRTVIERRRLQRLTGIVGETDPIREALERVVQIAPVQSTVLVTGESGTGKELVARGIHALSPRRHKPFIAVNVAALSDTLLESELFGHEKGAFTGAIDSRKGLFELAHGGTIFLDEIGEMPLTTQTKLLRVLETREFLRVGGERPIHVDVRVIAATNQDLRRLVTIGDFRRDLYYRLNVLHIELPPLRRRRADIPLLVEAFVEEATTRHERPFPGITQEGMAILEAYHWPGNVRELRNLVESMVVLGPGREIRPDDIPADVRSPGAAGNLLPAPVAQRAGVPVRTGGEATLRPELEFIFRTLVELRVDMDELKREFEAYRRDQRPLAEVVGRLPPSGVAPDGQLSGRPPATQATGSFEVVEPAVVEPLVDGPEPWTGAAVSGGEPGGEHPDVVVFRPGMTMEDLERGAIIAALHDVGGNRRKAAERLGIGERTLYRKIRKFELD
jgi:DNA-binding NtrC family response regulator